MLHQRRVAKSAYGTNSPTRESRDLRAFLRGSHIVREGAWLASEAKLTLETRLAEDRLVGFGWIRTVPTRAYDPHHLPGGHVRAAGGIRKSDIHEIQSKRRNRPHQL